jgi:hypothetical protein
MEGCRARRIEKREDANVWRLWFERHAAALPESPG